KGYSFINIGGLAIGMMVAILNGLWIWHEFSYNKNFANYDRIAKIAETGIDIERGNRYVGTTMTYPLSTELSEKYRQHFRQVVRASFSGDQILSSGETMISANGIYTGETAPDVFTFKMLQGTRKGLANMNSILISESLAESLFGTIDVLNRAIRMNNKSDVVVTGVYEDFPDNSEFNNVRFFAPWSLYLSERPWIEKRALNDWRNHFLMIYVEIDEGTSFETVQSKVKGALHFDPADQERASKNQTELYLYPMSRWHLYPPNRRDGQYEPIKMIQLVGAIGLFVLLLACINFMNLSTARSERRAKEVGIRKTIGSVRRQLINQFFSESFLIVFIAFSIAIILTVLALPSFNDVASKNIQMPWASLWFWLAGFGFVLLTSVLAGSYPALYLSSFNPVKVLKGTFRPGSGAGLSRKALVIFQFSISIMLIIGTAVVYQQIQFAKDRPVGYDRDGLIMIRKKTRDFDGKYDILRTELKNSGMVVEVSESMGPVTEVYSGNNGWDWKGRNPNIDESFATLAVSHMHGKTAGWKFIAGRDFDINMPNDSSGLVINESAAKVMGLLAPIGEPVTWTWWQDKSRVLNYTIIGVIKDMVMESPYEPVEPTMFYLKGFNGEPDWINVKINPQVSASEALPIVESIFKKIIPAFPFEYKFADEEYAKKFGKEERIGNLALIFAVLAIMISCLGLLGLASFVAERRTKEIGIRKVLGASVTALWRMLSIEFVFLVTVSCVVATPIAYYFLNSWLNRFVYHTNISAWVFVLTTVGSLTITLLTISFQAITAALMNP
ncbi:MAG TPA: ABC transporter permease, partial [Cyclobacteriaceae bacterium]|nr:ABC transporter permease [Cyclobacteriaceae bacterium]